MISDIKGIPSVTEDSLYAEEDKQVLGRDDFLKLFLAQLNHQDPLNPMDSAQFSSQLAQFSSLEQLFNVNENLESMKSVQDSGNRLQALDLMGKEIEAEGDSLYLEYGSSATGSFTLENSGDCTVLVSYPNGYPVREIYLGTLDPGDHSFVWDGRDGEGNMMDSGTYGFEVTAVNSSGEILPVETRIRGLVNGVSLDGEEPMLHIGETSLGMSQVVEVKNNDTEIDE